MARKDPSWSQLPELRVNLKKKDRRGRVKKKEKEEHDPGGFDDVEVECESGPVA